MKMSFSSLLSFEIVTHSERGTMTLGKRIAKVLSPPFLLGLMGELGSGKTTLVKGIAAGLGVKRVRSPSFTIIQRHSGRVPLYHVDLYRVDSAHEIVPLGLLDVFFDSRAIVVVEWAEKAREFLPDDRLDVKIAIIGKRERRFLLRAYGREGEKVLRRLSQP